MFAERLAVFIKQLGIGSFQHPRDFSRVIFAGVNLIAFRGHLQQQPLSGWRLQLLRNLGFHSACKKRASGQQRRK
jgi:hypothetical protein